MGMLWAVFTVLAAGGQTMRNAMQRGLTQTLGTAGATHVRFLYGLPFGLLFFAIVMLVTGHPMPVPTSQWFGWVLVGALTQIVATAMLLFAMKERSFVLITALSKTEPVHVAIFGLVFLADRLTWGLALAIGLATAGVTIMSWPKDGTSEHLSLRPILVGLASGAVFGMSAVGFRGAVRSLGVDNFVVAASTTLAAGLLVQVFVLSTYLLIREPQTLRALAAAWRPSVKAGFMGAFASQMWFLAFALESAAKVRTLALIEIFFAQIISRTLFKQSLASREGLGILCIVIGVFLLLNL
jgi:drug/metabolite transporter (DMT)-like permease